MTPKTYNFTTNPDFPQSFTISTNRVIWDAPPSATLTLLGKAEVNVDIAPVLGIIAGNKTTFEMLLPALSEVVDNTQPQNQITCYQGYTNDNIHNKSTREYLVIITSGTKTYQVLTGTITYSPSNITQVKYIKF
jgi:hypothetical protein